MTKSSFGNVGLIIDTGNPLLDHTVDGFVKISVVAAARAGAEDVYFMAKRGSVSSSGVKQSLKKMCSEGAYWGAIAGAYVGMEYGVAKISGTHDYKNAMISGALTGALVSAVSKGNAEKIFLTALTGGAIATAIGVINYLK
ncbi:outer envelope pore protein 16, chloroplastic-like [Silene latifolia]|uniref:outer envelope pore protein 16, chloroplastic-like n=1 Tax=Silene latifolia TaxID=37657 RepID=UPI003D785ED2